MRKLLLFVILTLCSFWGFATHNRAGEITYVRIAPFTAQVGFTTVQVYRYSFTIIHYTDHGPTIADRCEDTLYFGDGTHGVALRINSGVVGCPCGAIPCGSLVVTDPNYTVKKNIYTVEHTYAGPGNYLVHSNDPNRNQDVYNIPNSVNLPFYIESYLVINAFTGANSSPIFKFDPIDRACVNKCFYHNPGAFDPDGDSLSFEITTSRGADGSTVPGYFYPAPLGVNYGIDAVTGVLTWCSPTVIAQYNLAFVVKEWRKNTSGHYVIIGYVLRDMQVIVNNCPNNNPPFIVMPADICVEAGTQINTTITVTDPENNFVQVSGGGGAFNAIPPVAVITNTANPTPYSFNFMWKTTCEHIRQQPYVTTFKAQDSQVPVNLAYFASFKIIVVPPSVKNVTALPVGSTIKVSWSPSACNPTTNPIVTYKVYRKNDCAVVIYDPCKTGADPSLGYTYIGQTASTGTTLTDNNNGNGLVVGQDYSYLVIAVYTDGSQSFASTQVCAKLKRDVPILLNVDILSTSTSTGSVFVRWARPLTTTGNFDTLATGPTPGPYTFKLKYKAGAAATYSTVFTTTQNFLYLLDTFYTHLNVNTVNTDEQYEVEFIAAGTTTIGSSQKATSVFLTAVPGDRKVDLQWTSTTPWNNYLYTIYRKAPNESTFTAIATTSNTTYTDKNNVVNSNAIITRTYCYKILSEGKYSDPSIFNPLLNNSQEVCVSPIDLTLPCAPTITITSDCPVGYVKVEWDNVALSCSDDVIKYILFKKETVNDDYTQVAILDGSNKTSFIFDGLNLISNCFAIQSVDSSGNKSNLSPDFCVDNCPEFELPNIVTMNGDGANDFFQAIRVRQIKEIDLLVYDRWGNLVYKTTDPYFKWDGVSIISKKPVSEGTLFYICDVYEPRVTGIKKRNLTGWVEVVR